MEERSPGFSLQTSRRPPPQLALQHDHDHGVMPEMKDAAELGQAEGRRGHWEGLQRRQSARGDFPLMTGFVGIGAAMASLWLRR